MFSLNVSCASCKKGFNNVDAVYSTNCGHLFHFSCMNQWKSISTSCPVCKFYNPTTHSLYLNFDNSLEYEKVLQDLKAKVTSYENNNVKNQEEMNKKDKKNEELKRLYNISEQWRADLEYKIQTLKQQNQLEKDKHLEEIEILKSHIEVLEKDDVISKLSENYKHLITENLKLKKNLSESETLRILLNQRNETQEIRLKQMSLQFEKQFSENFKNEAKQEALERNSVVGQNNNNRRRRNGNKENRTLEETKDTVAIVDKLNNNMELKKSMTDLSERKSFQLTQPNDFRVVVTDFPKLYLVYPLQNTVIFLATKMAIQITTDDILSANLLNPKNRTLDTNKVIILVEFRTIETKIQFLKFTNRLKSSPTTIFVKIKEYVDEKIYSDFLYANRKLRANKLFEYIACKDGKVIAKKKRSDIEVIVIKDKNHVDEIIKSQQGTSTIDMIKYSFSSINDSFGSFHSLN